MVLLEAIRESNSRIVLELPQKLVAVFVGATSGIGETTLKEFVKSAREPRVYFVGQSEKAAARIKAGLTQLNPQGDYTFVQADTSLIKNVDQVCNDIKARETAINVLFMSTGTLVTGTKTSEGLHFFTSLTYYSRMRFIINLLPLLKRATALRRVVTVFAGTKEGPIQAHDFPGFDIGMVAGRGHFSSMITLALEDLAKRAPNVSFIQNYPGFVKTGLARGAKGPAMAAAIAISKVIGVFLNIPFEEVGQREVFFLTSARFPPGDETSLGSGVSLAKGTQVAPGTDGKLGSGVYSIDYQGESGGDKVNELLAKLRKDGLQEQVWKHTEQTFVDVTGTASLD
jgi:NAD(P)-dependent dehydrogenase (short-subunit alcohol dehydrogenase family)